MKSEMGLTVPLVEKVSDSDVRREPASACSRNSPRPEMPAVTWLPRIAARASPPPE